LSQIYRTMQALLYLHSMQEKPASGRCDLSRFSMISS